MSRPPTPSPAARTPLLSRRAALVLAIAFGAGLFLFLLLWLDQRNDTQFFRAGPNGPVAADGSGLPTPLPPDVASEEDNASGLTLPRPDAPVAVEEPRIIEEPAPLPAPPPPPRPEPVAESTAPVPVHTPAPRYPTEALRRGTGGTVRVRVSVASDGSVERIDLADTSGNRFLDRAAMEAVRRWRFRPALRGGQAVPEDVVVPIVFDPRN